MEQESSIDLVIAFKHFQAAQVSKRENAEAIREWLPKIIQILHKAGYSNEEIAFNSKVELVSVERWESGNIGIKEKQNGNFSNLVEDIIKGKSRHTITVNDTGMLQWKDIIEKAKNAKRLWHVSSTLTRHYGVESYQFLTDSIKDGLLAASNEINEGKGLSIVMVTPKWSMSEAEVRKWRTQLSQTPESKEWKGNVTQIKENDESRLPWFVPEQEMIVLEGKNGSLEAFTGLRLPKETREKLGLEDEPVFMPARQEICGGLYIKLNNAYGHEINQLEAANHASLAFHAIETGVSEKSFSKLNPENFKNLPTGNTGKGL